MSRRKRDKNRSQGAAGNTPPAPVVVLEQAEDSGEVARLREALSSTLAQLHDLQADYQALEKQLGNRLPSVPNGGEAQALRQQRDAAQRQCRQLQYQLDRLEQKYEALANSKLGRLTLNYWAQQKMGEKNQIFSALLFLFKWLFNRLLKCPQKVRQYMKQNYLSSGKGLLSVDC